MHIVIKHKDETPGHELTLVELYYTTTNGQQFPHIHAIGLPMNNTLQIRRVTANRIADPDVLFPHSHYVCLHTRKRDLIFFH